MTDIITSASSQQVVGNGSSPAHTLHTPWSLYYDSKKTAKPGQPWLDSLVHAHTVSSVEEFWAMVCTVKKPSQIELQSHPNPNYHFFRQGIKPQWEDPANKEGGRWMINITKEEDLKNSTDFVWEEVLMSLVGEYLDEDDLITGAVFSKRRGLFRVSIWTRQSVGGPDNNKNKSDESTSTGEQQQQQQEKKNNNTPEDEAKITHALTKIAQKLRQLLQLPPVANGGAALEFYPHAGDNKTPALRE